jgi:hypothetical protein
VIPRRSASCRSLASSSSGSLTVVLLMVCQHTPTGEPVPREFASQSARRGIDPGRSPIGGRSATD